MLKIAGKQTYRYGYRKRMRAISRSNDFNQKVLSAAADVLTLTIIIRAIDLHQIFLSF